MSVMSNEAQAGYNYMGSYGPGATLQQAVDRYWGNKYAGMTPSGGGDEKDEKDTTPATPAVDPYAFEREMAAERERVRRINAVETLRGLMESYGLSSLMGRIESYVKEGYETDAVVALIRTTPEYKERFPAMEALSQKRRAISEAAYIEFERNAAQLERAFGLPTGILGKDTITTLLTNEVSASELEERVGLAAAGAYQAPPEMRQMFEQYYGIGSGGLTAYFLDPDKALPLLNKQFATAQIGAEAQMQDFNLALGMAEQLTEAGISREQARAGFGEISRRRGFTEGRGDVVTSEQLVTGTLLQEEQAQQAIERAQKARIGRFQGGGGFAASQQGIGALGSAATR